MSCLTIIAHITAKSDKIDLVKTELLKLIPLTRAETGCLTYDLHQDNENPAHFMFYESWENRTVWRDHMNAPHLKAYLTAVEGAVDSFTIHEMTPTS